MVDLILAMQFQHKLFRCPDSDFPTFLDSPVKWSSVSMSSTHWVTIHLDISFDAVRVCVFSLNTNGQFEPETHQMSFMWHNYKIWKGFKTCSLAKLLHICEICDIRGNHSPCFPLVFTNKIIHKWCVFHSLEWYKFRQMRTMHQKFQKKKQA